MVTKKKRKRLLQLCECSDTGCPVHRGSEKCMKIGRIRIKRIDMEDETGFKMCRECASDALESGVFG